ncbi:MAG: hypothetical protein VCC01_10495, partial [Candidatus Hydrogenedentota bacterium]
IWTAASQGAVTIIQQHIDYGTDVNSTFAAEGVFGTGGTALHIALLAHKHEVAELLIEMERISIDKRFIQTPSEERLFTGQSDLRTPRESTH